MKELIYLTLEQAIYVHKKTIDYSDGGVYEYLDLGKLDSVLNNIQNNDYYPFLADKLTHLFWAACKFHCFADGNKRLAITLGVTFLLFNGYDEAAKIFFREMENISWNVAAGDTSKPELYNIMRTFCHKNISYNGE